MSGYELLDKMGLIDPSYVEAAGKPPTRRVNIWLKISAVAACVVLIFSTLINFLPRDIPKTLPSLPILTVTEQKLTSNGFEGYAAFNISDLVNANPWNNISEFDTLPVYDNPLSTDRAGIAWGADSQKLKTFIQDIADRLKIADPTVVFSDYYGKPVPDDYSGPVKLTVATDTVHIEVDQTMTAKIEFTPAITLPEEYNFSRDASYEDKLAVAKYFVTAYSELIGMENPQINITGGNYHFTGEQPFYVNFFDQGNNALEKLINYNFNTVSFSSDDEGRLWFVRICQSDLSNKVADYPIITPKEAQELLINGNYATNAPCEFPGKAYIKKVELIYRNSEYDEYYIPYYRFYVDITQRLDFNRGFRTYAAYYVPAVESAYIRNMPTYDGWFN